MATMITKHCYIIRYYNFLHTQYDHAYMVSTTAIIRTALSYQILQLSTHTVQSSLNGYHDHQTLLHNQILQLSTHTVLYDHAYMVSTTAIIRTVLSYQILQLSVWSRLNGYHDHQTLLHNQILQLSTHTVWSCLHGFDYHHNYELCYLIRYYNFPHTQYIHSCLWSKHIK